MSVSEITPIESPASLFPRLKDNTLGEDNTRTPVPSASNTMSNLGLALILTEDVRVSGARREFLDKFPDCRNVSFEKVDGRWGIGQVARVSWCCLRDEAGR